MSKYVTDEAMRSAMTLQKGYIDQGDNTNAEGIDSLKAGKNLLSGVITGFDWSSSAEAAFAPMIHAIEVKDGVFNIKEAGDNYIVSPFVNVEDGKTYTFSFYYINGGGYEINIIGSANNHVFQAGGGGPVSCSFTSVATEPVRILVKTDDKKLKNPQLEFSSARTEFTASTEELQKYIDRGDKANVEGIEALKEGKNLLMGVLTGSGLNANTSDDDWKSAPEAVVGDTLILHDLEVKDGVFSIKEAGDNYIVSPFVNVEEGKTYTFSFYYINGGWYEINIIGGQNFYQTQGATGGTITFTFTSVATQRIYIFIKTNDKKLKNPQLELGSKVSQFVASTEDLKNYIDSIEDRMEEVVQTQLITTPPATLNAQVGYYYCMSGNGVVVDTMTIQLPAIADKNKTKNVQFFMTMGSAPEVTFVSAGTERILYQKDFALEAERSYEVNALWNGHAWIITAVEIVVPPLNIITYEASAKLAEVTGTWDSGLHTNAFNTTIKSHTFENGVGTIEFDGDVTSIGEYAFYECSGLTSITIPSGVTSIGKRAFYSCSGLTSIVVDSANTVFDSRDNCNAIIKKSTNELIAGCNNTVIPDTVTSIGEYAFGGYIGLTSITIPDSVTEIADYAFANCRGLTSVSIPDSVTSIGEYAFGGCSVLTSITIPDSVTNIGNKAFSYCPVLTSITSLATTAPTIASWTFFNVKTGGTLRVPSGSTGYDEWMSSRDYYLGYYDWTKVEQ